MLNILKILHVYPHYSGWEVNFLVEPFPQCTCFICIFKCLQTAVYIYIYIYVCVFVCVCFIFKLWMGTHPNGPSMVVGANGEEKALSDWIETNSAVIGDQVKETFGGCLPFLFKVLSVNKSLSIQAHPNKKHAEQLHAARPDVYKDSNHKPEMAIGR